MRLFPRWLPLLVTLSSAGLAADAPATFVDDEGVMRWSDSRAEVALFGVNYCSPFAHGFRAHQRLGVPLETAIDADVYHLARLGFDVYRVHVWDREISDAAGNLLVNEHVRAFDYLLAKLKERGIKFVLTPLQFGNAGYPEPGEPLPGFSSKYGKQGSLEDRTSWPLQERYLSQFLSHVNPHTGLAYKDDPSLIAVEICNEPGHFEYDLTLEYINRMVGAIRGTGCEVPILYNMSHGLPVHQAYLDAEVQGGTFQWYPTNLVAGHEQRGNVLPYVDRYPIPFTDAEGFRRKARIVYEFDPADTTAAYLYPAMARTFRKSGFQIATQFAYDPLHLAPFNTEYQTHYLNLAYSPKKAVGLMIAAEVFRRMPRLKDHGEYPANTSFEGVRISYEDDLVELVTDEQYLHSNDTTTAPPAPARLVRIAGAGQSPVIDYPGTGVIWLDRLEPGVWRLEVMPDAIPVRDVFEKPSPGKRLVEIAWNTWPMRVNLPDLGADFEVRGINDGNTMAGRARQGRIDIRPGVYLLARAGQAHAWTPDRRWGQLRLGEYVAPAATLQRPVVRHVPPAEASAGETLRIAATVAAPGQPEAVEVVAWLPADPAERDQATRPPTRAQPGGGNTPGPGGPNTGGARIFPMQRTDGLTFAVDLPADELRPGTLRYHIVVRGTDGTITYPSAQDVAPFDWRFTGAPWSTRLVEPDAALVLFAAGSDAPGVTANHRDVRYPLVPSDRPGTDAMRVAAADLAERGGDHSFRFFFADRLGNRSHRLKSARRLVLYGRSAVERPGPVQLALVTTDGITYGATIELTPEFRACGVDLSSLRQVRAPNIPHGYPSFIPFWSSVETPVPFDASKVESVLVSIGPGLADAALHERQGVEVERIWLE